MIVSNRGNHVVRFAATDVRATTVRNALSSEEHHQFWVHIFGREDPFRVSKEAFEEANDELETRDRKNIMPGLLR